MLTAFSDVRIVLHAVSIVKNNENKTSKKTVRVFRVKYFIMVKDYGLKI